MFLFYIFIFLFGLVIGSFLNVIILRLENGWKIVNDRSKCMNCRHVLSATDLVPVLSFLALRGKCRYCGKKISWQYPIVEITTGIMFVMILDYVLRINGLTDYNFINNFQLSTFNFQLFSSLVYHLIIASSLIVIFVYDLKHYIIPDKIVYSAIGVSAVYRSFGFLEFDHWDFIGNWKLEIGNLITLFNPFIAAVAASAFFLAIVLLTRGKGMGGGDIKLAFLMGLFLGTDKILISLAVAFTLGAVIGIILIILKKKTLKSAIPFGPFLAIGTIVGLFLK